jgi:hypothetical protein
VQDPASRSDKTLIESVEPLLRGSDPTLTLGAIVKQIEGDDGPGLVLFVLTLPVLLPLPPGVSMIMALPLLIVAPQIMIGRSVLWFPKWLSNRQIKRAELIKVLRRVSPSMARIEAAVRPRLRFLTGRIGRRAVGAACTLVAVVLVLPIPFANLVPSLAMGVFAVGLTRKDGVFILAGYGLILLSGLVIALGAHGAIVGIAYLKSHL